MVAGITALIIILFLSGGQETFLLDPELKKNVKEYVVDKDRLKEIDSILKEMDKNQKAYFKEKGKTDIRELKELNLNYNASREDFDKLYVVYFDSLEDYQSNYWKEEIKIRSLITEDEWTKIIAKDLKKPEKEKVQKELDKAVDQIFDKIEKVCSESIVDSVKLNQALSQVEVQKGLAISIVNDFLSMNYQNLPSLKTKSTSLTDFEKISNEMNDMRKKLLNQFTDLRFELVKNTNEDEWKKIAKELEALYEGNSGITF